MSQSKPRPGSDQVASRRDECDEKGLAVRIAVNVVTVSPNHSAPSMVTSQLNTMNSLRWQRVLPRQSMYIYLLLTQLFPSFRHTLISHFHLRSAPPQANQSNQNYCIVAFF